MKVAHLTTADVSVRYLLLAQADAALRAGYDVIAISAPGEWVEEIESHGLRHVALHSSTRSFSLTSDARAALELIQILRQERPDILHTHNPKPGFYGRIVGRILRVPLVVNTTHGLYATDADPLWKRLTIYLAECIASRASHIELCQNPEDFVLLRKYRIVPRRKICYLGNGISLDRFRPMCISDDERVALRNSLGFKDDEIVIGTVARLVKEKGIKELAAAVQLLGRPFRLLHVGTLDPEKSDALDTKWIKSASQRGAVFVGQRSDVDRLYQAMDVFSLPSYREGFPRAAMEAAASGLPVVATDIRGCRQVVDHGRNGFLVPVKDVDRLAESIARYLDASLREEHGKFSRTKAEGSFDENQVAQKVLAVYELAWRRSRSR